MVGANPGQHTNETANQMISTGDKAIHQTTGHLTKVGSYLESIEHHLRNALVFEYNLTQSLSPFEDTDMAEEMLNFISLDIRQQGDRLIVSQANKNTQDILSLLTK